MCSAVLGSLAGCPLDCPGARVTLEWHTSWPLRSLLLEEQGGQGLVLPSISEAARVGRLPPIKCSLCPPWLHSVKALEGSWGLRLQLGNGCPDSPREWLPCCGGIAGRGGSPRLSGCARSEQKEGGAQAQAGGELWMGPGQSVAATAFLSPPVWTGDPSVLIVSSSLPVLLPIPGCLCLIGCFCVLLYSRSLSFEKT